MLQGVDDHWYVFVTINTLQDLLIFFAFGLTGSARVLVRENPRHKEASSK